MKDDHIQSYTLETAFEEHGETLYRFVLRHIRNVDDAHDIVQEVFVRTWRYQEKGNAISHVRGFLFKTARNLVIDTSRKKTTDSLDALIDEGFRPHDEGAHRFDDVFDAKKALGLLETLPESDRDILTLRYLDDLSPKEIAEVLDIRENTVSVRIHRAAKKLQALLDSHLSL